MHVELGQGNMDFFDVEACNVAVIKNTVAEDNRHLVVRSQLKDGKAVVKKLGVEPLKRNVGLFLLGIAFRLGFGFMALADGIDNIFELLHGCFELVWRQMRQVEEEVVGRELRQRLDAIDNHFCLALAVADVAGLCGKQSGGGGLMSCHFLKMHISAKTHRVVLILVC